MALLCEHCKIKPARVRFCSDKCKDNYHNAINPRGRALDIVALKEESEEEMHHEGLAAMEMGWDGHKEAY